MSDDRISIVVDRPHERVCVVRFVRPDLREWLYDAEPIGECRLCQDIIKSALHDLPEGHALVLNFGLIEWFPSVFFRVLIELRNITSAQKNNFYVCCLPIHVREAFDLMGGSRLFEVRATEHRAVHDGAK